MKLSEREGFRVERRRGIGGGFQELAERYGLRRRPAGFRRWEKRRIGGLAGANQLSGIDKVADRVDGLELELRRQTGIRTGRSVRMNDAFGEQVRHCPVLGHVSGVNIVERAILADDDDDVLDGCLGGPFLCAFGTAVFAECRLRQHHQHGQEQTDSCVPLWGLMPEYHLYFSLVAFPWEANPRRKTIDGMLLPHEAAVKDIGR